jgi:DnaJ-class molecular chaperone
MTNFYEILEVPETSSIDEIKKSYRRLSMMYHPDKNKNNPDSTSKFQKISEAYETLGDHEKKREYDSMRRNPFINMSNNAQNPMEDILANLFGGGMPFGHMQSFGPQFGSNVRIFHNGMPVNGDGFMQRLQKPTPIIKHLVVPIDKILTGTTIPINIDRWVIQDENKVFENETVYVTVPKLFIKIENNTEFQRVGLDLIYEKTISVKEALCSFSFELKYITGKVYTINNSLGNIINHGYRKIIPNMGFSRDQHIGNLIISFNVKFPDKLTEETIEKLKIIYV